MIKNNHKKERGVVEYLTVNEIRELIERKLGYEVIIETVETSNGDHIVGIGGTMNVYFKK